MEHSPRIHYAEAQNYSNFAMGDLERDAAYAAGAGALKSEFLAARTSNDFEFRESYKENDEDDMNSITLGPEDGSGVLGAKSGDAITPSIICVLFTGVFIANADTTLVLATYGAISSDFDALDSASWLGTSYTLATCVAQPIIGQLCNIYSRKYILLLCYCFFAVGNLMCGLAPTIHVVILGRVVAGLGGAGMTMIVSIIISDVVPLITVASWRGYINIFATLGRSLGGPLGGFLADIIGWRSSFLTQVPLVCLSIGLVSWNLPSGPRIYCRPETGARLRHINFTGASLLGLAIMSILIVISMAHQLPYYTTLALIVGSILALLAFLLFEIKFAKKPLFPSPLLTQRNVIISYCVIFFQMAAQLSMLFSVPLYFQATQFATSTDSGFRIFPAVLGNTIGGLMTGWAIKRTGRYKHLTSLSVLCSTAAYFFLIQQWNETIRPLQSLELVPSGFGTGGVITTTFIALTAKMGPADIAMAISGMYLATSLGIVSGIAGSSFVQQRALAKYLLEQLDAPRAKQIISGVTSDVYTIGDLEGTARRIVISGYVSSIRHSFSE